MRPVEIIFEVTEAPDGGYDARALGHSIFTQGEDWDDLKVMVRDAVLCHFDDYDVPRVIRLHTVIEEAHGLNQRMTPDIFKTKLAENRGADSAADVVTDRINVRRTSRSPRTTPCPKTRRAMCAENKGE